MATSRIYEDARALLAPYMRELAGDSHFHCKLRLRAKVRATELLAAKKTWISLNLHSATPEELTQLRALAEIVSQLSKSVDFKWRDFYYPFWKDALMTQLKCSSSSCGFGCDRKPECTEFDNAEQLLASEGPRFALKLSVKAPDGRQFDSLRNFLFMDPELAMGEERWAMLAKLSARGRPRNEDLSNLDSGESSTVPLMNCRKASLPLIELGLALPTDGLSTSQYRELAELLEEFAEQEQVKQSEDTTVRYEISTLWMPSRKPLEPIDLGILATQMPTIQHLHFQDVMSMLIVDERLQGFQRLLRARVCGLGSSPPTLETLQLHGVRLYHQHVVSTCSALRDANSLKELDVEWARFEHVRQETNTKVMWAWIAYGIFHPDSEAKLDSLNLSGLPIKGGDIAAFEFILSTPHPGKPLWIIEHGDLPEGIGLEEIALPAGQRVFVQLKTKTKLRVTPKVKSQTLGFQATQTEEFEVAIELTKWICVVIPGCGLGWVPSASAVSRREIPSKCPSTQAPGESRLNSSTWPLAGANVKTFSRHRSAAGGWLQDRNTFRESIDDIKFLLRMIGHCLEGFHYTFSETRISNGDLGEILDACPNLTHLDLMENELEGITALSDRYLDKKCHISSLNIHSKANQEQILAELGELLASPTSLPLRYLAVSRELEASSDRTPVTASGVPKRCRRRQTLIAHENRVSERD